MATRSRRVEPYPAAAKPPVAECQAAATAAQRAAEEAVAKPVDAASNNGAAGAGKPKSKG
eukprot:6025175-Lingulodinium_polyedra.AAC.1